MDRTPKPGERYRHFKNKLYQIVAIAEHSETKEPLVIYQALYGDFGIYARPLDMFVSEVDHVKYPYVSQKYRFERVDAQAAGAAQEAENAKAERVAQKGEAAEAESTVRESAAQEGEAAGESSVREAGSAAQQADEEQADINPKFMAFLESESFDERYNILVSMQDEITDRMIDSMAVVMDVSISEGPLLKRYDDLKNAIRTRQRYEFANRLK